MKIPKSEFPEDMKKMIKDMDEEALARPDELLDDYDTYGDHPWHGLMYEGNTI